MADIEIGTWFDSFCTTGLLRLLGWFSIKAIRHEFVGYADQLTFLSVDCEHA